MIGLIAIASNYDGYDYELPDCELDTENAERACESFASVLRINGKKATPDNVRSQVRSFLSKLAPEDLALVYFSGHGTYDTVKGRRVEAIVLHGGGVIYDFELRQDLLTRPDGTLLAAASDSCFSGGLPKGSNGRARTISIKKCKPHSFKMPSRSPKRPNAVFTASKAREVSYSTGEGGAFSNVLWKVLTKSKSNTTLPGLFKAIRKELPNDQWPQTPEFSCDPALTRRTLKSFVK